MRCKILLLILFLFIGSVNVLAEDNIGYVEDCLLEDVHGVYDLQTRYGYRHRELSVNEIVPPNTVQVTTGGEYHILEEGDRLSLGGDVTLEVSDLIAVDPAEGAGVSKMCFKLLYEKPIVLETEQKDKGDEPRDVDLSDVEVDMIYHDSDVVHVIAITNAALELDVKQVGYEYYSYEEFSPREVDQIYVLMGPEFAKIVLPKDPSDAEEEIAHLIDFAVSSRLNPTIVEWDEISQGSIDHIIEGYEAEEKDKEDKEKDEDLGKEEKTEKNVEEPIDEPCNGCRVGVECIPKGIRHSKDNQSFYCGLDSQSHLQKATGEVCENDFECQTNTCNSGTCIDLQAELQEQRSLLERILGWLGSIFS